MTAWMQSRLSPFRHRGFRAFFLAQTLSMVGTMAHDLARSWIVLELMGRAGALGAINMAIAIPCLVFVLWGGVVVDRMDVRRLMMFTKILLALSAMVLALVVEMGHVQMWMLIIFALVEGFITSFDAPAFQKVVVTLIPREDFQQAMAVNSTNFHTARTLGPIIAGGLMAWHGPSLVFLFDAITYFGVAIVLAHLMSTRAYPTTTVVQQTGMNALADGMRYLFGPKGMKFRLMQLYLSLCLIYPILIVVFRAFVQKKFELNSEQFGYVFMFPAIGSLAGALSFAIFKPSQPIKALKLSIPGAGLMVIAAIEAPHLWMTTICMSLAGFFSYLSFASLTVSMQLAVKEEFRGRLTSLISLGFVSIGPLMTYPVGTAADVFGVEKTVVTMAITFLLGSAVLQYLYYRQRDLMLQSLQGASKPSPLVNQPPN